MSTTCPHHASTTEVTLPGLASPPPSLHIYNSAILSVVSIHPKMLPIPSDSSQPSAPLLTPSPSSVSFPIISLVSSPRPLRDLPYLLLFLLLSLSTFALGILSIVRPNPSTSCRYPSQNLSLSLSLSHPLTETLAWTLTATAAVAAPIALLLLALLRRFARQVVYASVPLFILVPSFLNLYWFFACRRCSQFPLPYRILTLAFVFVIIAIFAWIIVANWNRIELTVRIVRISAAALAENVALLAVLPLLWAALAVYFVPVVVFLVFASGNGRFVEREDGGVHECVWKQESWIPAYYALAIVTMIWTVATMVEAQVYVISGTIAQWYFAQQGPRPRRSIRSSLR